MDIRGTPTNNGPICGRGMSSVAIVNACHVRRIFCRGVIFAALLVCSCTSSLEERFYDKPPNAWPQSLAKLPPRQRWSTYLWGVRHIKPPPFELAVTLAKGKEVIVPFIVEAVLSGKAAHDSEATIAVLQMMREVVRYDPCEDAKYRQPSVRVAINKIPDARSYLCR